VAPSWPPTPDEFYLPSDPSRPVFQGDVFDDVPFVKAKLNNAPARDPNVDVERRRVAVLGYPCDLYQQGRLVTVQPVALVRSAERIGIPDNWAGAFTYSPLPDLRGEGDHAVVLQAVGSVDARFLVRDKRLASLSEVGWAVFRQRLALCATRMLIPLDDLTQAGRATWQELELWTRWNESGRDERQFTGWLDGVDPAAGGFARRDVLERGSYATVLRLLQQELGAS
jgi:hypothetical protein